MTQELPNAEDAFVPDDKLRGYILNPDHADGTHKCRVFQSVFGIGPDDCDRLERLLIDGVQGRPVADVRHRDDCTVYGIEIEMTDLNGIERRVNTVWKVPRPRGAPSFVTAYLDTGGKRYKLDG